MAEDNKPEQKKPETISFDYLKSNNFRVLHADGAFIGLSATGLTVCFFSERQPIPRRVVHAINPDGTMGKELTDQRVVRDAVVRDTEVAVAMAIEPARNVHRVLGELIASFDGIVATQKAEAE